MVGDTVVKRMTLMGTHLGAYMGIAPTGRQVEVDGFGIYRIENGRIAEITEKWGLYEMLAAMGQAGVEQAQ